jgi:membrane dipeptidase
MIFDGHNDVLTNLYKAGEGVEGFLTSLPGHIDLPRARSGGFGGGFFAIWVPSHGDFSAMMEEMKKTKYALPIADQISRPDAISPTMGEAAMLLRLEVAGALTICRTVAEIEACRAEGRIAAIMHLEGAEAIDPNFHMLDVMYAAGLRSLGPVWSRPTRFGEGVPFAFPAGPDHGAGLTVDGERLVAKCNQLGVMIDLSHLNEAGFWDVAQLSDAPLVATHSNAHAITPHARNLTDKQLDAIAESDGMVGLNFATGMLRPDGAMLPDTPLSDMLAHLDHLIGRLGETRVGFGSDFDGATVPEVIGDVAGLPVLVQAMLDHGYDDALVEQLCWGNWMRVLKATWGG